MSLFRKKPIGMRVEIYDPPEQHARIIVDSLNLMNKTLNPDTYFGRYKLAQNEACTISGYKGAIYDGMDAEQIFRMLYEDSERIHRQFIDRVFAAGRGDVFAYQMFIVGLQISKENREYIVRKYNGKKFHFCEVKFADNDSRTYTYVTKDQSVQVGDTVTVPVGNGFVPDTKVVQVMNTYDASLDSLKFPIEKLRCVESKLRSLTCPHCGGSIVVDVGEKVGKCNYCQAEFFLL